jgi:hypothetical protein
LLIDDVEGLWRSIAEEDAWGPFYEHMEQIETARQAMRLNA